jgi:TolB protein
MLGRDLARLGVLCLLLSGCDSRRGFDPEPVPSAPQKIAFSSNRDDSHYEIYVMEADGTHVTRLTNNTVEDAAPLLSPDGSKITFRRATNPSSVFVMNADGTHQVGLAPGEGAAWSPDGSKLALVTDSLCVMNSDATGKRSLGVGATFAAWKPDGSKIAYVSTGLGGQVQNEIYTIYPNGTGAVRVTVDGATKRSLDWSPDGTQMVYSAGQSVYVINADGTGLSSPAAGRDARWSPDGQRIIFVTDAFDGNEEIYSVRLDGTDPQNLSRNHANDIEPDWGPRR